jgi:hypothetical protein
MSHGFPQGMTIAPKDNLYYAQYDMEYSVKGNGDNVIKADKYRLNLYYNPLKRGEKICDIQHSVSEQSAEPAIYIISWRIIAAKQPIMLHISKTRLSSRQSCRSCCRIWKEWRTEKPDSVPFSHLSSMERNTCSKAS